MKAPADRRAPAVLEMAGSGDKDSPGTRRLRHRPLGDRPDRASPSPCPARTRTPAWTPAPGPCGACHPPSHQPAPARRAGRSPRRRGAPSGNATHAFLFLRRAPRRFRQRGCRRAGGRRSDRWSACSWAGRRSRVPRPRSSPSRRWCCRCTSTTRSSTSRRPPRRPQESCGRSTAVCRCGRRTRARRRARLASCASRPARTIRPRRHRRRPVVVN